MNITILVKGKSTRFSKRLSLGKLVSSVVLLSVVLLVSSRSTESVYENQIRLNVVKTGLQEQLSQVNNLQTNTGEKLNEMVSQLASMQSKLEYLDSVSANIAEENGLTKENFVLPDDLKLNHAEQSDVSNAIDVVSQNIEYKIKQLEALESILIGLNIEYESKLAGRPLEKGWLSSHYGMRKDPFTGRATMHKGVDFAGKEGTKIIATAAGIVTWSSKRAGYGLLVEVDHGNGYKTRYGHNKSLSVAVGDVVTQGQELALLGNTGRSTGAHVHYEVLKNDRQIDPLPFVYK